MIYYLAGLFTKSFGPARLLQSYTVLIILALYVGFFLSRWLLPVFFGALPLDRGREYAQNAALSKGKPTGAGFIFITIFVFVSLLFVPLTPLVSCILVLTYVSMLTGFLDDKSTRPWGEYKKGLLDLVVCVVASVLLTHFLKQNSDDKIIHFWLPLVSKTINIPTGVFVALSVVLLWLSINTTNCTDGVDGLSGTLVLIALLTLGVVFYFILGHIGISSYLLVPHIKEGATYAVMVFALSGTLMGYLWHNAFPSSVLMGDAGSRALGFFIGACVMLCGNPFMIFATSSIMFINGGMGLIKVALLRFFGIKIFSSIRFPLHDHMRKEKGWSANQVLIKFMICQLLITTCMLGFLFKVR